MAYTWARQLLRRRPCSAAATPAFLQRQVPPALLSQQTLGCSSESSSSAGSPEPKGVGLDKAQELWRATVQCEDLLQRMPSRTRKKGMFYTWISTKAALHHARQVAPDESERFESLQADLLEGSEQCLRFLVDSLGGGSKAARSQALQPPFLDEALGEQLQAKLQGLTEGNCDWRWEVDELSSSIQRTFLILGGSRGGPIPRERYILNALGQQFVFASAQSEKFTNRENSFNERIEVFQDLLFSDMVLVADVSLTATQRAKLLCASEEGTTASVADQEIDLSGVETVSTDHVLRLEMALTHGPDRGEEPRMRAAPWQLVDWNWICLGNHPSLPPKVPAPW